MPSPRHNFTTRTEPRRPAKHGEAPPGADLRWPDWAMPILRELPLPESAAHDFGVALGMSRSVSLNATAWLENEGLAVLSDGGVLLMTITGARFIRDHYMHAECGCFVCLQQRTDWAAATAWLRAHLGAS